VTLQLLFVLRPGAAEPLQCQVSPASSNLMELKRQWPDRSPPRERGRSMNDERDLLPRAATLAGA
jgi:hypothetical protein